MKYMREIVLLHQDSCPFQSPSNEGKVGPWSQYIVSVPDMLLLLSLFDEGESRAVECNKESCKARKCSGQT
jgi:hypothetical protein